MPVHGSISCDGNQTKGTTCVLECDNGYSISGSANRTCLPTSEWSGIPTSCEVLQCKKLEPPKNGLLILPCYTQYEAICSVKCADGYYSNTSNTSNASNAVQMCQLNSNNTVYWSDAPICYG